MYLLIPTPSHWLCNYPDTFGLTFMLGCWISEIVRITDPSRMCKGLSNQFCPSLTHTKIARSEDVDTTKVSYCFWCAENRENCLLFVSVWVIPQVLQIVHLELSAQHAYQPYLPRSNVKIDCACSCKWYHEDSTGWVYVLTPPPNI